MVFKCRWKGRDRIVYLNGKSRIYGRSILNLLISRYLNWSLYNASNDTPTQWHTSDSTTVGVNPYIKNGSRRPRERDFRTKRFRNLPILFDRLFYTKLFTRAIVIGWWSESVFTIDSRFRRTRRPESAHAFKILW